jgi:L-rhamnose mutarotase
VKRYGMTLMLRDDPDAIARYRREHARVWPEVLARLRASGITGMRIYLLGRRLFMELEARDDFDPAREFPRLVEDERYREWDELMRTMQERSPEARPDEWWAAMELVFDLDWPQHEENA